MALALWICSDYVYVHYRSAYNTVYLDFILMITTYLMVLWGMNNLFDVHLNLKKWLLRCLMAVLI